MSDLNLRLRRPTATDRTETYTTGPPGSRQRTTATSPQLRSPSSEHSADLRGREWPGAGQDRWPLLYRNDPERTGNPMSPDEIYAAVIIVAFGLGLVALFSI